MATLQTLGKLPQRIAHASKQVWDRTYSDFLMPDRLGDYRALIEAAREQGYCFHSVLSFSELLAHKGLESNERYIVLRHDVDSDPDAARQIWELEVALGVCSSSYYFRLCTFDAGLMRAIAQSGHEASYHYEEVSQMAKQEGFTTKEEVNAAMSDIRGLFKQNLTHLREETGLPMHTVAAHGDFVNRRLGVPNQAILADDGFRNEVNIQMEAYDRTFLSYMTAEHSDTHFPQFWLYADPAVSIGQHGPVLHIIVHPQNWHANFRANAHADAVRIWQEVAYRWAVHSRHTAH